MKLLEAIGEPATLEQLAEECVELAHAALKLARVERGENPTPKTKQECTFAVVEEAVDVAIIVNEIYRCEWFRPDAYNDLMAYKNDRMSERIEK